MKIKHWAILCPAVAVWKCGNVWKFRNVWIGKAVIYASICLCIYFQLTLLFWVMASYYAFRAIDRYELNAWEAGRKERDKAWAIEKRKEEIQYNNWILETQTKISQKGFSSLGDKDRDELFFIYQLLVNGGSLNQSQKRIIEVALGDPIITKFLELRGAQGNTPHPRQSLNPQMTRAFSALGIVGTAGVIQRHQIQQELNDINERMDEGSGGEADSGGFDF